LMNFAAEAVKKRLEPDTGESEHDLIRAFLKNGLEPEDVVQECITLVVAGTETTTVAIRMTMLALLTNPPVYAKLQAEIDAYYADKPSDHIISYSDTKSLPYLQAVIREGMRLWPPAAGLMTKEVPKGGDVLHGHFLPEGTEVGQIMVGIGRQPEVWGPDAEVFRPERWFDVDPGKREEMVMASDINFSAGKYLCLGKSVALMEIGKFLSELLRRYDLAAHNAAQPAKVTDPLVWITSDFFVRFTRREGSGLKKQ
jgi:cytochrome P450